MMGGSISKNNTRINILLPKKLKCKIEESAKAYNRSAGKTCLGIITDPTVTGQIHKYVDMSGIENMKVEGKARMNLVVPIQVKELLQKEADNQLRSLNNYIVSLLYVFYSRL